MRLGPKPKKEIVRFMDKVQMTRGCWFWTASTDYGYGRFRRSRENGRKWGMAHRFSWEYFMGPIPEGRVIDHLCRVRNCVNPYHLELVTGQQNSQRGATSAGPKKVCPNGHPYRGDNLYIAPNNNGVGCMACRTAQSLTARKRRIN